MLGINRKKSAGVAVSAAVHAAIQQGNRARDRCDWAQAVTAYRTALADRPDLHHIWVQLGHMLKEAGRTAEALAAYEEAERKGAPRDEARLHLAHLLKNTGDPRVAGRYLADLIAGGDDSDDTARALVEIVRPVTLLDAGHLRAAAREGDALPGTDLSEARAALDAVLSAPIDGANVAAIRSARELIAQIDRAAAEGASRPGDDGTRPLVFDISDLVAHFRHHRLPTGIQRVQIEVLAAALKAYRHDNIGICCFIDGRDHWIELPISRFLKLAYLSSTGSEADWLVARASLFLHLALDDPYELPERAILVNLGTSWWIYDYFRLIREAKAAKGIAYIPMVHDLIPILAPQYCVSGVTADYVSWMVGVFQHADGYLANSESTKRDLIAVAAHLGHDLIPERVVVVSLDADFRRMASTSLPTAKLRTWALEDTPYALFVSTIEARKNHTLAFEAWAELLRRHGPEALPRLVCVGRRGWLNDQAFELLAKNADLRAHVTIIDRASDDELALLYRSCRFTVYPSHYEGWGLPVTESLCYGRVPVVADNSSLPEAGGEFALVFESDSVDALVAAVETAAFDDDWREARERRIAEAFRPRPWGDLFRQIGDAATHIIADQAPDIAALRTVATGTYYPVSLYRELRIWRSLAAGEIFRVGDGWLWPETDGCRTTIAGGELCMSVPTAANALRLYLRVRGLADIVCPFALIVSGETVFRSTLRVGEQRWVMTDLPDGIGPDLSILVKGEAEERIEMSTGGSVKRLMASLTVIGFAFCRRDDEDERLSFVEVSGLGDVGDISAYRERATAAVW